MYNNNLVKKFREILSKNDIPDLSPGGVVGDQPLPNEFQDVDMEEAVAPLEKLKEILKKCYPD